MGASLFFLKLRDCHGISNGVAMFVSRQGGCGWRHCWNKKIQKIDCSDLLHKCIKNWALPSNKMVFETFRAILNCLNEHGVNGAFFANSALKYCLSATMSACRHMPQYHMPQQMVGVLAMADELQH